MPPFLVADDQLIDRVTALFRERGFDAASLTEISAATGLQKSSLYHRFPGGKQQMAAEVIAALGRRAVDDLLAPLAVAGDLRSRVELVARNLAAFYDGGRRSCLLDSLSIGTAGAESAAALQAVASGWVEAFAGVAREAGASRKVALERAEDAVAAIEGALVLARVRGDTAAFRRSIKRLPDLLMGA